MRHMQTIELDGNALKAAAEKSHEFKTLAYYGAHRQRNSEVTDIDQMRKLIELKHKEKLDADKWIEAFEKLEDMGMGSIIRGQPGAHGVPAIPNRFRWNYSLKTIGTAAMNGENLTAHRIIPTVRAGRVVNDYHSAQPSTVNVAVKKVDKGGKTLSSRNLEVPIKAPMEEDEYEPAPTPARKRAAPAAPAPSRAAPVSKPAARNLIYIPLRPDFVFEAEIPTLTAQEADIICNAIKRFAR